MPLHGSFRHGCAATSGSGSARDIVAGATLAAVAIPECMGYTSIAQTPDRHRPVHDHLPDPALRRCSAPHGCSWSGPTRRPRRSWPPGLGGGGDQRGRRPARRSGSPTAASSPSSAASCSSSRGSSGSASSATSCSASVLIGFLTGVGVQVLDRPDPGHARRPEGHRHLVRAAVGRDHVDPRPQLADLRLRGSATILIIRGFKRFIPKVPGAIVAVVLFIAALDGAGLRGERRRGGRCRAGRLPADRPAAGHHAGRHDGEHGHAARHRASPASS